MIKNREDEDHWLYANLIFMYAVNEQLIVIIIIKILISNNK
jgi:hypothetical protein